MMYDDVYAVLLVSRVVLVSVLLCTRPVLGVALVTVVCHAAVVTMYLVVVTVWRCLWCASDLTYTC